VAAGSQTRGTLPHVLASVQDAPSELAHGTLLLLDMVDDARVLFDDTECLGHALERVRQRLHALGARRIWMGNAWVWDLKPDDRPGDLFEL
jgi:hypothetical protein